MVGYSETPLIKKLGIKEGMRVRFIKAPKELDTWLGVLPDIKKVTKAPYDFVLLFVNEIEMMEEYLARLRHELVDNGMIWVAWYKKAAKKPTEITEDTIRDTALPLRFVDVKVCAVSEEWSGLKLVIRVTERKKTKG